MKRLGLLFLTLSLSGVTAVSQASSATNDRSLETKGTVQRLILNPEGDVDGLLLEDGTQVNFPPHMSGQLTAVVAKGDKVDVKGFRENAKVFKAETIRNIKTSKVVAETPPPRLPGGPDDGPGGPPPPPPHRGPRPAGPPDREGLMHLSAQGTIRTQLYGPRGDVNGVVLSDGSIVRFAPRMLEDSKVKTDVGDTLKVSGFGTTNSFGQALEATEMTNN